MLCEQSTLVNLHPTESQRGSVHKILKNQVRCGFQVGFARKVTEIAEPAPNRTMTDFHDTLTHSTVQ